MTSSRKRVLLSTTMVPFVVAAGVATGGMAAAVATTAAPAAASSSGGNPDAAPRPSGRSRAGAVQLAGCGACNPCNPCNPCAAACSPCNPCAAACSPCNPCAAANPCNPCNPCAAACNPCSPCAAAAGSATECVVPRLQQAATKGACSPCNPCAAACSPCNPCAAANPCNPCNPCAAACNPCNPCAAANPCNPCAAACSPCNPCAAANPCNPCNPCAAANPCNPCAAACGACSPCGGGKAAELKPDEAVAVYDCLLNDLKKAYAKSDDKVALSYTSWRRYSTRPYVSQTHGGRHVQNYANERAKKYGLYEKAGTMPVGSVLAKDSFTVSAKGKAQLGPLFIMQKMEDGFSEATDDWRYSMIMPNGNVVGVTGGKGSKNVEFCAGCHMPVSGPNSDSLLFLPKEVRVTR